MLAAEGKGLAILFLFSVLAGIGLVIVDTYLAQPLEARLGVSPSAA